MPAVNLLAVLVAAVLAFGFGGLWYWMLSSQWLEAQGKTPEDLRKDRMAWGPNWAPFAVSLVALLVMAFVLATLIGYFGPPSVANGLLSAFFAWLGFVATTVATNYAFADHSPQLAAIDSGHWLGVLLIMGLVIGLFGT
jgi:hypothetical protein